MSIIKFYDVNADEFFKNTVDVDMSFVYEKFLKKIPGKGEILDLGCGSGRDSKYFLEKGYKVTAVDFSPVLAKKASEYIGQKVEVMNMLDVHYEDKFVGVWACASLLHLSEDEIQEVLENCIGSLKEGGVIYASFKYGDKNYTKDGRTFTCFTEDKFDDLVSHIEDFAITTFISSDVRPGRENEKWLNVIMKEELEY